MCSGPHAYATYGKFCGQAAAANIVKICSDVFKTIACSWEQRLVRWLGRAPAVSFFNRHTPCILRCVQWGGAGIERSADGTFCVRRRKFREGRICFGNNALNRIELAMICILWMTAVTPCRPKTMFWQSNSNWEGFTFDSSPFTVGSITMYDLACQGCGVAFLGLCVIVIIAGLILVCIKPLKMKFNLNYISRPSPYRAVNTVSRL